MPRILRPLVLAAAVGILAGCTQLSPTRGLEQSLLFHPQTDAESWAALPANVRAEDVWLRTAAGLRIHAWWLPQPGSSGALLFCHGNGGNLSLWAGSVLTLQRALHQSVLIFDYPGYGKSAGKPSEKSCYASADAAWEWLTKTQQVPAGKIIIMGESLGGGVATELAARQRPRALVLVRTFTSVPDMARNNTVTSSAAALVTNRFDSLSRIARCQAPVFVAHGDRDQLIPLAQGQKLYDAAGQPKRFYLLQGLGHNDPLPIGFYDSLNDFLRQ